MLRKITANATRAAIILLDPPFRAQSQDYGEIKDSVYNPILEFDLIVTLKVLSSYKEVQQQYESRLDVPDVITLHFPDANFDNNWRSPTED
ncbi:hypothetical protein S40285_07700 [Stachybotrys chlorohalonatus IBT 40285]|uniref:Uncharacterized protein n=1 Tax=Stachybotrys chlorohalonatus (strain IBT 40285) TaxID=1283841 RepID=A0A084QY36_STAC4|nr:hypothetical protein S40285_07700 [Stachybotrys chlorohalonata IBT 40285]